jgi:hypothetical protein
MANARQIDFVQHFQQPTAFDRARSVCKDLEKDPYGLLRLLRRFAKSNGYEKNVIGKAAVFCL